MDGPCLRTPGHNSGKGPVWRNEKDAESTRLYVCTLHTIIVVQHALLSWDFLFRVIRKRGVKMKESIREIKELRII